MDLLPENNLIYLIGFKTTPTKSRMYSTALAYISSALLNNLKRAQKLQTYLDRLIKKLLMFQKYGIYGLSRICEKPQIAHTCSCKT